jgi:hypothetical protein
VANTGPEFRLGAGEIQSRVQGQCVVVALCPSARVLFDSPGERMYNLPKEVHRLPLRLGSASRRSTAKWGNCAQAQNGRAFWPGQG